MDDDEVPVSNFFSRRANIVLKASAEERKAAIELVEKMHEEKSKVTSTVKKSKFTSNTEKTTKELPEIKKMKTRSSNRSSAEPEADPMENILDGIPSVTEVSLSSSAKRRLRKLQKDRDLELQHIEAENQKILSAVNNASECSQDIEEVSVEDFENIHVLTISYMSEISRIKCYASDKFSLIFPKVAEIFKLKVSEFLLCFRDKNIAVDDTPKSLKLTNCDVLECIPYKAIESAETRNVYDVDMLNIFFQSNDLKEKIDLMVHKVEKLESVMERYSDLRNVPLSLLTFEFDGEKISGAETPEDLDMESGSCIDVTVLAMPKADNTRKKLRSRKKSNR